MHYWNQQHLPLPWCWKNISNQLVMLTTPFLKVNFCFHCLFASIFFVKSCSFPFNFLVYFSFSPIWYSVTASHQAANGVGDTTERPRQTNMKNCESRQSVCNETKIHSRSLWHVSNMRADTHQSDARVRCLKIANTIFIKSQFRKTCV